MTHREIREIIRSFTLGEKFTFNGHDFYPAYLGPVHEIDDIVNYAMGENQPVVLVMEYLYQKILRDKERIKNKRPLEKISLIDFIKFLY
jgi:hypothetical protein